jgi:hypothetical protein
VFLVLTHVFKCLIQIRIPAIDQPQLALKRKRPSKQCVEGDQQENRIAKRLSPSTSSTLPAANALGTAIIFGYEAGQIHKAGQQPDAVLYPGGNIMVPWNRTTNDNIMVNMV